jgi:two-component sensor histidine kinase
MRKLASLKARGPKRDPAVRELPPSNELVVNAETHALSGRVGKLNVSWQGMSHDDGFELRWQETGGPPLPAHRQPGFGTVIVDGMIEKQLKGKIDRHWIDTGLMMIINVPGIH